MGSSGLEPPTSRLSGARSNQLSYEPACRACPSSACLRAFTRFHHQLKSLFTTTMEMMGFEPMTPCLQGRCSPNWATPPLVYRISFLFQWAIPHWKLNNNLCTLSYCRTSCLSDTVLLRKEVIQPHLPIRLPCYDLTPIIEPTFDCFLLAVRTQASGVPNFHGLTGGVYKARERIHRGMLIRDY